MDILAVDAARLVALLTVWHTDEVTDEDEAKLKGLELIKRMQAEAGVKLFVVDYHHRHGNDCSVVASDAEPTTEKVIEGLALDFEPEREDEYINIVPVEVIAIEGVKRCARCGGVILSTGFCSNDCPFDRHLQTCKQGWLGHPDHPEVQEGAKCDCPDEEDVVDEDDEEYDDEEDED